MADLSKIRVRDVCFTAQNNRIQWRLSQWRYELTLADLDKMSVAQLYTIPGMGKLSVNAIVETVAKFRDA